MSIQFTHNKKSYKIDQIEKNSEFFLKKNVIMYGASKSGKTTIIKDIMFTLRDVVPIVYIFCPTAESQENMYREHVPRNFVFENFEIDIFHRIFDRQKEMALVYKNVNNYKFLYNIVEDIDKYMPEVLRDINTKFDTLDRATDKYYQRIEASNHQNKTYRINEIKLQKSRAKIDMLKKTILGNRRAITTNPELVKYKRYLKFLYANPCIMLVFDDCAAKFKEWARDERIKELFIMGRHYYITSLYSFQNDTFIDAQLRTQANVSIFTNANVANIFACRANNGIDPAERKRMMAASDAVFGHSTENNYKKLAYVRDDPVECLKYFEADIHLDFLMCSQAVRENVGERDVDGRTDNNFRFL